jgi:hypothetical protein
MLSGERERWPVSFEYATADYRLARVARKVWDRQRLQHCTGLNLCFFRAPSVRAWKSLDPALTREVEDYCQQRARSLILSLAPRMVVVIGLGDFSRMASETGNDPLLATERVLVRGGSIWGIPCVGIIHLSGARISAADLAELHEWFRTNAP